MKEQRLYGNEAAFLRPLFISLGLVLLSATAAGAAARDGAGEKSVLPPAVPPSPARAASPGAKSPGVGPEVSGPRLEIPVFRAGQAPYAWVIPGRTVMSFVTDTPDTLECVALARVKEHPDWGDRIRWSITPPAGFQVPPDAVLSGPVLHVVLKRPGGNPTGEGEPLSLAVMARLGDSAPPVEAGASLQQDPRDRLRQEYVDLQRAEMPAREDLLDEGQFDQRYGQQFPDVTFAELNWSKVPGKDERYTVILATEPLLQTLEQIRKDYGLPVSVCSGFRNPVHQNEVHAAISESHHQYGRALDLLVTPDSAVPHTGRKTASEADWLRLAACALRCGGTWIEPMLDCHVNTDGCHVHVDVRTGAGPLGVRSRLVLLTGRVLDPSGNPVPEAEVRVAGMPAKTNADGQFALKHVLVPKEYPIEVQAPGRTAVLLRATVAEQNPPLVVRVPADPDATFVARVERVTRIAGAPRIAGTEGPSTEGLNVRVALRNVGQGEGQVLRLAPPPALPASFYQVGAITPDQPQRVRPGGEAEFEFPIFLPTGTLTAAGSELPLRLLATYQTGIGASRTQDLLLPVVMPDLAAPLLSTGLERPRVPTFGLDPAAPPSGPEPLMAVPHRERVLGPLAAGMALGGAAALAGALARRRPRAADEGGTETTVDPARLPGKKPAPQ